MTIFDKIIFREDIVLSSIIESIDKRIPKIYTYLNQHSYNIYRENESFRELLDQNFITFIDGIGVYLACRLFGKRGAEKFNATDLNSKILEYVISHRKKVFIIGGSFREDQLTMLSGISAGYLNGYLEIEEYETAAEDIIASGCDLIIIAMGIPKQEFLAVGLHSQGINVPVLCVGNFLEFYLKNMNRAPGFLRKIGLEWFFRLLSEPERLWRRYLLGIPRFIFYILFLRYKLFFRK